MSMFIAGFFIGVMVVMFLMAWCRADSEAYDQAARGVTEEEEKAALDRAGDGGITNAQ